MPVTFTKENAKEYGRRGGVARALKYTPEQRREIARKAANRRWYKYTDSDMDRVDRHLRVISGIVGMALGMEDYVMVLRAMTTMVPFERMKIALNSGMLDVTPRPQMIEEQAQIESKLQAAAVRRRRAFVQAEKSDDVVETTSTKVDE